MICRWNAVGLSLLSLLALMPTAALCQSKATPLQLRLGASHTTTATTAMMPLAKARHAELRAASEFPAGAKRAHVYHEGRPTLRQRALQGLFQSASEEEAAVSGQAGDTFRFERRGNAGRNISQGYKRMCATVSEKIWDDPDGKSVKFDVAGKPGVAVVIPLR